MPNHAAVGKLKVDTQGATTQIAVITTTLVKGKVVQLYPFAPYAVRGDRPAAGPAADQYGLQRASRNYRD
jgi:hypothetical protein